MPGTSPALLRRKIGALLRQHREALGQTAVEVANVTGINASVISRIETGSRPPGLIYVRELSRHYGLEKDEADRLVRFARASQENGWWEKFDLKQVSSSYIEFEAGASLIQNYELAYIPGLLQTQEYASSVVGTLDMDFSESEIDQTSDARRERQRILTSGDPVDFHAIVNEAALYHELGGNAVLLRQLKYLLERTTQPNIELQVLPFQARSGLGLLGAFSILSFNDEILTDVAYAEGPMGSLLRSDSDYVDRCKAIFAGLTDQASNRERSAQIIESRIRSMENDIQRGDSIASS